MQIDDAASTALASDVEEENSTQASYEPATRPAEEAPIYIYWTGPLNVKPYPAAAVPAGESLVTLEGAPVIAKQQTSEIRASRLIYRTEDGSLHGSALPGTSITMTSSDAHGASVIKTTSLVAFIGVTELFQNAEIGLSQTFKPVEYFLSVAFWYLVLTAVWSVIQAWIERRLAVSERGEELSWRERIAAAWTPVAAWGRGAR